MLIHSGLLSTLDDENDQWDYSDALSDIEVCDPSSGVDSFEYGIALQKLPTETDLMNMEARLNEYTFDESILKGERRTGLRH